MNYILVSSCLSTINVSKSDSGSKTVFIPSGRGWEKTASPKPFDPKYTVGIRSGHGFPQNRVTFKSDPRNTVIITGKGLQKVQAVSQREVEAITKTIPRKGIIRRIFG